AGGFPGSAGDRGVRLLGAGGVFAHGRALRELDASVRRPARHAHRHVRRPRSVVAPPLRARRLLADRPAHGDRAGGQERDPHRRVRQGRLRGGHAARRCRARRRPCASARPLHALVRVHPGPRAVADRRRRRRGGAPDPRPRRDRRDADRHAHRQSLHLGELLCQRALPPGATTRATAGRGACSGQRRSERRALGGGPTPMTCSASRWISVVTAALLAGCAIGPDYKRPSVAEPAKFRGQATAEAASFADAPWWDVFQDPVLKALIKEALSLNYDVAIAAARVQEARANVSIARSDLFPSFDYSGGASRSKVGGVGILGQPGGPVRNATSAYFATMSASWEVDIWGRIRRANEAARANLLATEEARRGVWLTLVSDL